MEGWFLVENSGLGREEGSWVLQVVRLEGGGYAPAGARLQADAGSPSLQKIQPYVVLSPVCSPGAQQITSHHQASSPARLLRALQGGGWLSCRAGDGPSQRELLSTTTAASGGAQQSIWQPACFEGTVCSPWATAVLAQLPPISLSSCNGHGPRPSGLRSWLPVGQPWVREGG